MQDEIQFIPFTSPHDNGWAEAGHIYANSFPYKEQRSPEDHLRALSDPRFKADGIWLSGHLAGILYHWRLHDGLHYVEHLAISPQMRGQDLGSRALSAFRDRIGRLILEIDPPIDEISVRRLHFYQRLKLIENSQKYLHPSFREPFVTHQLVLMSYPDPLTDNEVRDFADFVREIVLRYSGHSHPQLPRF